MVVARLTAERITDSTNGAALLELLERQVDTAEPFTEQPWDDVCARADHDRVERAAEMAVDLPLSRLLELLLIASSEVCSFWDLDWVAGRLEHRHQRTSIAEVLAARFNAAEMTAPGTREQWWWTDGGWPVDGRLGERLDEPPTYWATRPGRALMTTSVLPDAERWLSYWPLITGAFDQCFGPSARWRTEVDPQLPLYEVNDAEDWVALVRRFPKVLPGDRICDSTELAWRERGFWRRRREMAEFARFEQRAPGQRYASRSWDRFLEPAWAAVADEFSGVHLTWRGFLLADGTLSDLGDGDVTMLRNWGSEGTLWLGPVVVRAEPLPIPPDMMTEHDPRPRVADSPDWQTERVRLTSFAGIT